jgi:hypothetical protein
MAFDAHRFSHGSEQVDVEVLVQIEAEQFRRGTKEQWPLHQGAKGIDGIVAYDGCEEIGREGRGGLGDNLAADANGLHANLCLL